MESVYNTVGCSNCSYCCAYSYAGNAYCAQQRECNGPKGTSLTASVIVPIVCVVIFAIILIICYKLGRDRTFEQFEEKEQPKKKESEMTSQLKDNNQITEFNIEDAQENISSERGFDFKVK